MARLREESRVADLEAELGAQKAQGSRREQRVRELEEELAGVRAGLALTLCAPRVRAAH